MEELAQVVILLLGLAAALAYAQGGWTAVAAWFRVKLKGA